MTTGDDAFQIAPTTYDDPVVRRLDAEVQQEYVERYGGPDETAVDTAEFAPPGGVFLVGWVDGRPVATGALRRHDADSAEVKRMFVPHAERRHGYARAMLAALEERARELGYRRIVLETGAAQPEAIALYESHGYSRIDGFGHYRDSPLSRSFAKEL
jgi:GNAT superfamily N-acetyltransferase